MIIKQLSVFLENKTGRLYAACEQLAENTIDISALSLADTAEFGVLRLIVDDPEKAKTVLNNSGIVVKISHVVAVAMDDVPGGAVAILKELSKEGLSIEYMYACVGKVSGKALMIIRTDDNDKADKILREAGYNKIEPKDIYRL